MKRGSIACAALSLALGACDDGLYCTDLILDGCHKAEDLIAFVGDDIAASATTGNAILGQGGALHSPRSVALSLRTNMMHRATPQLGDATINGQPTSGAFSAGEGTATSWTADIAMGALQGKRIGETRIGGLDVLGSVMLVPQFTTSGLTVDGGGLGLGGGLRLGIMEETRTLPGVSLSATMRFLPKFELRSNQPVRLADGTAAQLSIEGLDVDTRGVRLAASKQFWRLSLTGGVGKDWYDVHGKYRVVSTDGPDDSGSEDAWHEGTRNSAFASASLALGKSISVGAEAGRLFANGPATTFNTFSAEPSERARTFATVGVRLATSLTRTIRP